MTSYSDIYSPPAPTVNIKLRNPANLEPIFDVPMLLDTGADLTLVPRVYCDIIGANVSQTQFLDLEGFDGATSRGYYVHLDLIFLNRVYRGNYLTYDQPEGILGRDILNKFSIVFDGPNLNWKEQK